jgi:hypothetical protein
MPCHARSASVPKKRRRSSLKMSPPRIVAKLDLSREVERETQVFLKRACSGRWPMWRLLGMKRHSNTLTIAVEWLRHPETLYSLVELALDKCAMNWRPFPTAAAACAALAALDTEHRPPPAPAAPAAACAAL